MTNCTVIGGRRSGKIFCAINTLIQKAIETPGDYEYIVPTFSQAEMIAWTTLKYCVVKPLRYKIWENKLKIELITGGSIQITKKSEN